MQCDSVQNIQYVHTMYRLIVPMIIDYFIAIFTYIQYVYIRHYSYTHAHECTYSRDKPWHSMVSYLYHTSEAGVICDRHHKVLYSGKFSRMAPKMKIRR